LPEFVLVAGLVDALACGASSAGSPRSTLITWSTTGIDHICMTSTYLRATERNRLLT
jgi:hypothetical protein